MCPSKTHKTFDGFAQLMIGELIVIYNLAKKETTLK